MITAELRVDRALERIKAGRSFTPEQEKWLDLIRRNLIENLPREEEDIECLSIFTREGASRARLDRIFGGKLGEMIQEMNAAIAGT